MTSMVRDQIFISHSHQDKRFLEEFRPHLKLLEREVGLDFWDDTRTPIGSQWREDIQQALQRARVGVLLVSAEFLASEFIACEKVPKLLQAAQDEGVAIIWALLRPCLWEISALEPFQAAHDTDRPLADLAPAKRDGVWTEICRQILAACKAWRAETSRPRHNPFDPWTPAVPPRFFGRRYQLRRLEVALYDGHSISLVGDRRIGKSSLLRTWCRQAQELAPDRKIQLLSGEGPEGGSVAAFVTAITGEPAPDEPDASADMLTSWLDDNEAQGPPVFLVDEVDRMIHCFKHRFFERLRGLLDRLQLVLASRRDLDRIYSDLGITSPFHNRLQPLRIGLLEEKAAEQLRRLHPQLLQDVELDLLEAWAGRHAFYAQLLARHLVDAHLFEESAEEAMDVFLDEAGAHLRNAWQHLEEREQEELLGTLKGTPALRSSLRRRGLTTLAGEPFGEVLRAWMRDEL